MTTLGILGLLGMAGGLVPLWFAARCAKERREMGGWPTATGRVTGREVRELPRASERHPKRFAAGLVYEYVVAGRSYRGERIAPSTRHFHSAAAGWDFLRAFQDEVQVYYNPNQPERAILRRRELQDIVAALILGIVLVGIGLVLGLVGLQ